MLAKIRRDITDSQFALGISIIGMRRQCLYPRQNVFPFPLRMLGGDLLIGIVGTEMD